MRPSRLRNRSAGAYTARDDPGTLPVHRVGCGDRAPRRGDLSRPPSTPLVCGTRRRLLRRRGVFARVTSEKSTRGGSPPDSGGANRLTMRRARTLPALSRVWPTRAATAAGCVAALDHGRTAAALVATASVCQEVNDLESAARDLDEALALAPEWAAAHFERGKVWLRLDDMEEAAQLVPSRGGSPAGVRRRVGQSRRHARRTGPPGRGPRGVRAAAGPRSGERAGASTTSAW